MKKAIIAAGLVVAVAGCNPMLFQVVASDAKQAAAISTAVGDQAEATCANGFADLATAAGGEVAMTTSGAMTSPMASGIMTKIAVVRGVRQVVQMDCGGVAADFLSNVLHGAAGPLAGLIP